MDLKVEPCEYAYRWEGQGGGRKKEAGELTLKTFEGPPYGAASP